MVDDGRKKRRIGCDGGKEGRVGGRKERSESMSKLTGH
jgi:hypothetical protein